MCGMFSGHPTVVIEVLQKGITSSSFNEACRTHAASPSHVQAAALPGNEIKAAHSGSTSELLASSTLAVHMGVRHSTAARNIEFQLLRLQSLGKCSMTNYSLRQNLWRG